MLKTIAITLIASFLSLLSFLNTDVTLNSNLPETAKAGEEFLVEITISKGDIEGFARFEQSLPVGFTAVGRETVNGKFEFTDQKVKITWMRVPFDREFVISYAIQVDPTISGSFDFEGKFSFIKENAVQAAAVPKKSIYIQADEMAAGIAEQSGITYNFQDVSLKNVDCIRQKPYLNDNNEVIVNLMINKGELKDFGKIQEQIPRGYKAISLRSKNSIFTSKNQIIKFLWMNMPSEEQFVVSYKLVPEGEVPDQAFLIVGTFSYAENERTKTINIAERAVDMSSFSGDELVAQNNQATETETNPDETTSGGTAAVQTGVIAALTTTDTQTSNTDNSYNANSQNNESITQADTDAVPAHSLPALTSIPMPENGVGYRVQVAAGHKLVKKNYFKKLNVTDDVQTEIHEGWHKYTIGNFNHYKDARDYRVYVWNNTPINDAFVAAYNSGLRITVQEALMIANQKWYK